MKSTTYVVVWCRYDKSFERKNFKNYHSERSKILGLILKEKMEIGEGKLWTIWLAVF